MNETISKADLVSLFDVVEAAAGLYNALERGLQTDTRQSMWVEPEAWMEFDNLGMKLRVLGLSEVK